MKTEKIIFDVQLKQIHVFGLDDSKNINYSDIPIDVENINLYTQLNSNELLIVNNFINLCDDYRIKSRNILEEPLAVVEPVYILQTTCPVDNTLTAKVYDINYSNDKKNNVIRIDVRVIHYNQSNERVPKWDADTYIICDMTEDRKVSIPYSDPIEYEYSYILAETFLQNGVSINKLISTAINLAEFEPNSFFLQRIYNQ